MTPSMSRVLTAAALLLSVAGVASPLAAQTPRDAAPTPTRTLENRGGVTIKVLLEAANLEGAAVELAELTLPPGPTPTRGHRHGSTEIIYVLEGELNHIVNGTPHRLGPGGVGVVRPGDEVIHGVLSTVPVRALVIWSPGGEVERIAPGFTVRAAQ